MEGKRRFDARKLDHKTLEEIRIRTVEQVLEGESPEALAKVLDINPSTIYKWLQQYHDGGWDVLKAKPGSVEFRVGYATACGLIARKSSLPASRNITVRAVDRRV